MQLSGALAPVAFKAPCILSFRLAISVAFVLRAHTVAAEFYNGVNFLSDQWSAPRYDSTEARASLKNAAASGANSIAVVVTWFQPSVDSSSPIYRGPQTVSDSEIAAVVQQARARGMSVLLRPAVDPDWRLPNTSGTWRGEIGRRFSSEQWDEWFSAYARMMTHYARVAANNSIDVFSVGMELTATQSQVLLWRALISEIRQIFPGKLTYGANWDSVTAVKFFDALDFIAVDAYYPLAPLVHNATVRQLVDAWQQPAATLQGLAQRLNTTVLLTELGYCSSPESHADPAHKCGGAQADQAAQLRSYAAARCISVLFFFFFTW
jgi:hypothetical protein